MFRTLLINYPGRQSWKLGNREGKGKISIKMFQMKAIIATIMRKLIIKIDKPVTLKTLT